MRRLAGNGDQFQSVESKAAAPRLGKVATDLSRLFFGLRGGRFSHRRQANSLILLPGERLAATQFRVGTVQGCRAHFPQTHRIKTSRHKPSVYPLHRHLVERLSSRLVYGNNRSERAGQWRCQNQTKRMFA
jgi:hypothetical protein